MNEEFRDASIQYSSGVARKRHWLFIAFNASSGVSMCETLSAQIIARLDLSENMVCINWLEQGKREFEWIIVVSHRIEKGAFLSTFRGLSMSVRWSLSLSREALKAMILFGHGTPDQSLAKREGVSCDARGKLLISCLLRWRPYFFRFRKSWVLGAMKGL